MNDGFFKSFDDVLDIDELKQFELILRVSIKQDENQKAVTDELREKITLLDAKLN